MDKYTTNKVDITNYERISDEPINLILNCNNNLHLLIIYNVKYLYKKSYKTIVLNKHRSLSLFLQEKLIILFMIM